MTPVKLQMHNFLSYREPKALDFETFNLAVLSGDNGVGKSSILEAITWAIWGKTRANSDDSLIFQGEKVCYVELIFEHEKNLYRILRKREIKKHAKRTGQSFLEFQVRSSRALLIDEADWKSIAEATIKATSEKIIKILKIPYEIFVNSSYLRQGHADEFTSKTASERKDILSEVLDLGYYEELSAKAREKARISEDKIKLIAFNLEDLQSQIAMKGGVEKSLKEKLTILNNLTKKKNVLKHQLIGLDGKRKLFDLTNEKLANLREKWQELGKEKAQTMADRENLELGIEKIETMLKNKKIILDNFENLKKIEAQNERLNEKAEQYQKLTEELRIFDHIKSTLNNNITRIHKISNCPTCLRPMNPKEQKEIIARLQKDFEKTDEPKLKKLLEKMKFLGYDVQKHQIIRLKLRERSQTYEAKQRVDLAENDFKNMRQNLDKLSEKGDKILKQEKLIEKEGKRLKAKQPELEKAKATFQVKNEELERVDKEIFEIQGIIGQLKQEFKQIEKYAADMKLKEKEQKDLGGQKQSYEELALAFGKKGIQAMIIETSVAAIEEEANVLLGKITDERMSLRFITQKEKKANAEEIIETLEIQVRDEFGTRDYEMFSGGEAFRINFAIRIALSKLLASRAGTHLKFLAIDEGFGMLDTAGRDDLVATINSISPDFEKILVITHLQELKDLFPTKIEITKDQNGSHIEVGG